MLNNETTKDRILNSALTLFAEKGYDGVGVDLIAEKSGLKGPSIYKHFKSKEDILMKLMEKVDDYYEMNFGSGVHLVDIPSTVNELIDISLKRIMFTMHDETIRNTRKILMMEQFRNPYIAAIASRHSIVSIQEMYRKIFQGMIDTGLIKQADSRMLSIAFTSPITLLIQMCDREPEREEEVLKQIREFFDSFVKMLS